MKFGIVFTAILFAFFAGRFAYWNIIVPWPYRHELRACLDEAALQSAESAVEDARNICFRTYPHFN